MTDVVQRSVDLAYRVVDEYVRQGQRAARGFSGGATAPRCRSTGDMQDAAAQMTRFASDGMRIWLELPRIVDGRRPPADARPRRRAARRRRAAEPPAAAAAPTTTRVRLAISHSASRRSRGRPAAGGRRADLVAHALRAADAELPPLSGATFVRDPDGGPLTLRLACPTTSRDGIYNGLVIDAASNRPVGTLSVRIGGG